MNLSLEYNGSVKRKLCGEVSEELRALFKDKDRMDYLFSEICASELSPEKPRKITLNNLLNYFSKGTNPFFIRIVKHPQVLCQAFSFATKKKHEEKSVAMLPQQRLKLLLCCAFYFSLLYEIFQCDLKRPSAPQLDAEVIDIALSEEKKEVFVQGTVRVSDSEFVDMRLVSQDEYVSLQSLVQSIDGVRVDMDTTMQMFAESMSESKGDNKGMVSFAEFCTFATKHISIPDEEFSEYCKEYALVNSEIINPEETEIVPDLSTPEAIQAHAYKQEEKEILKQLEDAKLQRNLK